jgi:hypothetical protein
MKHTNFSVTEISWTKLQKNRKQEQVFQTSTIRYYEVSSNRILYLGYFIAIFEIISIYSHHCRVKSYLIEPYDLVAIYLHTISAQDPAMKNKLQKHMSKITAAAAT